MSEVQVSETEHTLIGRSLLLLATKAAGAHIESSPSRDVPEWLPSGEEVKTVEQAALLMGCKSEFAARYIIEQKEDGALREDAERFLNSK